MRDSGLREERTPVSAARHVYVHVPFCARRCSYCDFAIAVRREVPVRDFLDALRAEIATRFPRAAAAAEVRSLYLGGGTPSRLAGDGVGKVVGLVRDRWATSEEAEVTVEANPEDVDVATAEAWRRAGVTRVSLGVQSFDDRVLSWMHRSHDSARVHDAVRALREAGISDWSLDLIYALPAEVTRDWRRDLEAAIALDPPHLSAYGLTVEPHTPVMRWRERGLVHEAVEERYEEEFCVAHEALTDAGYEHYEVSNYARDGHRALHNSAYWERVPYVGLGPSAHSFDGAVRRWNEREYVAWMRRARSGEDPLGGEERLTVEQAAIEEIYLGLRSLIGVEVTAADRAEIERWTVQGWATVFAGRVRLTPTGWLRLDALSAALTDVRSR